MSAFPLPAASSLPRSGGPVLSIGPALAKVRAAGPAEQQMQAFPARWLAELPLPPRLVLHVSGVAGLVRVELGEEASDGVGFSATEWVALCRGIEADRIWPADFVEVCRRKAANPAYRLELDDALGGVQVDENECWTLERVLERVDAHLVTA